MIKDVPTAEHFEQHGLMFLNLAWDSVIELLLEIAEIEEIEYDDQLNQEYWRTAKNSLAVAHALSQQGAELVLKSKIASVSPYLLIVSSPSEWPRNSEKHDTSFADFRTIDAQDLIRAWNTTQTERLPDLFVSKFNEFRKQRNSLFHTVDHRLVFSPKEIILYILGVAQLIQPGNWRQIRLGHLVQTPIYATYGVDHIQARLCRELDIIIEGLGKTELKLYFGFDKNRRRYICPNCWRECNSEVQILENRTALLVPNSSRATNTYCFVCDSTESVLRKPCSANGCKGNVFEKNGDLRCLVCFEEAES